MPYNHMHYNLTHYYIALIASNSPAAISKCSLLQRRPAGCDVSGSNLTDEIGTPDPNWCPR